MMSSIFPPKAADKTNVFSAYKGTVRIYTQNPIRHSDASLSAVHVCLQVLDLAPIAKIFCGVGLGMAVVSIPVTALLVVLERKGVIKGASCSF